MAWTGELVLFLVPRHCATQVRTDGGENAKPLTIFCYIDCLFGDRFAPPIDLLNLNGAHHRLGQGRKLGERSHGRLFEVGGASQERKQSEPNERHRKQRAYKE